MPGKRQHYVPRFVLRRFAVAPGDKKSPIYKLQKKTGKPGLVNPANEAVIGRYYQITTEDGVVHDEADLVLDKFENDAATVIASIADPAYRITGADVGALLLFILTLKQRTPQAREALRENFGQISELEAEAVLSDREEYHRRMANTGRSAEEIESTRLSMLEDLQSGRVSLEATAAHEVGLMFMSLEHTATKLFEEIGIVCLRVPERAGAVFVTSDNPVAHYDPTPKSPEAGVSFMSSPNSITQIALDPRFALMLVQDQPRSWTEQVLSEDEVDEANLLTYAWAREAIYGPSQQAVTRVRAFAKHNPRLLGELRYRPPRIWLTRGSQGDPECGPMTFTSRYKDNRVDRSFHVASGAMDRDAARG